MQIQTKIKLQQRSGFPGTEELTENFNYFRFLNDVAVEVVDGGAGHLHLAQVDVDVEAEDASCLPATLGHCHLKSEVTLVLSHSSLYMKTFTSPRTFPGSGLVSKS